MKYWTNKRITYAVLASLAVIARLSMLLVITYALVFGAYRTWEIWQLEAHPVAQMNNEVYQLSRLEIKQ